MSGAGRVMYCTNTPLVVSCTMRWLLESLTNKEPKPSSAML